VRGQSTGPLTRQGVGPSLRGKKPRCEFSHWVKKIQSDVGNGGPCARRGEEENTKLGGGGGENFRRVHGIRGGKNQKSGKAKRSDKSKVLAQERRGGGYVQGQSQRPTNEGVNSRGKELTRGARVHTDRRRFQGPSGS